MKLNINCKIYPVLLVLFGLLLATGCKEEKEEKTSVLEVKVSVPIQKKITEWDEFTGRFRATNRVEVRARVSGYIDRMAFTPGQMVKKGDLLFVIDQRPFVNALNEQKAALEESRANLLQVAGNFERVEDLRESGAVSVEEYSRREQAVASAKAGVSMAEALVSQARLNLNFTRVTAPITGRVDRDLVNPGNLISGGNENATLLTTLVSVSPIHFYFQASESDLLKYTRLQKSGERKTSRDYPNKVQVQLLDEDDYAHEGVMDFVSNEISESTGTLEGRAVLENADGVLEPGMFGRIRLSGSREYEALLIPDRLVQTNQTVKFLYTIDRDSVVRATNVSLGEIYAKEYRIINNGLEPDDRLVLNKIQQIQPDSTVSPITKQLQFKEVDDEKSGARNTNGNRAKTQKPDQR